jgi:hypothetical protein
MTLSRKPFYARQWSYETGRRASGLIRKVLSHHHKIPKSKPPSALNRRCRVAESPKALVARARNMVGRGEADDQLGNGNEDPDRGSGASGQVRTFRALKRLRGPAPSSSALELLADRSLHVLTTASGT